MLKISNVTKFYGSTLANNNVSIDVNSGEIAILVGPNGAGKSTLIKSIMGLIRFSGSITVEGVVNTSVEAKCLTAYVPEVPTLYEMLTVGEHIELIARAYKLDDSYKQYASELLERFELSDKLNKCGKELSKGMQQKVSICTALLVHPKVILFDEPMVGLDPHAIKELKAVFVELKAAGCAVLISTHMLDSVEAVWDSATIMMKGEVVAKRTRAEIEQNNENLEDLFFAVTDKVHSTSEQEAVK